MVKMLIHFQFPCSSLLPSLSNKIAENRLTKPCLSVIFSIWQTVCYYQTANMYVISYFCKEIEPHGNVLSTTKYPNMYFILNILCTFACYTDSVHFYIVQFSVYLLIIYFKCSQ